MAPGLKVYIGHLLCIYCNSCPLTKSLHGLWIVNYLDALSDRVYIRTSRLGIQTLCWTERLDFRLQNTWRTCILFSMIYIAMKKLSIVFLEPFMTTAH